MAAACRTGDRPARLSAETTDPSTTTADTRQPTPTRFGVIYTARVLVMPPAALDTLIVATALPTIVAGLDAVGELSWIVTAYALAAAVVMPVYGKLSDRLGAVPVFFTAVVLFIAGSVLCGAAPGAVVLAAGRAVQGLGGGGMMIGSQAIVSASVPVHRRAVYLAPLGGVFGVAGIGPLVGGALTDTVGWRWIYVIKLPLGVVALVVAAVTLRLPRARSADRFDTAGTTLLTLLITCVVVLSSTAGTALPWTSAAVLGGFAVVVVSAVAWWAVERRAHDPLIPLALLRSRVVLLAALVGLFGNAALFGIVAYLPTVFQEALGVGSVASGLLLLLLVAGLVGCGVPSGKLFEASGRHRGLRLGGLALSCGGMLVLGSITSST